MFYKLLRSKFLRLVEGKSLLDNTITIRTHILKPDEAIGNPDRRDFPLLKGKEVLMQATFFEMKGQAYTDNPSEFSGPLREIVTLSLHDSRQKALFIASLNAVMKYLHPDIPTVHCKNNEPEECAKEMVTFIKTLHTHSVGIIGLQPAILDAMVTTLGKENVICVDRDEVNKNKVKYGIYIGWGDTMGIEDLFKKSDVVLATGSSAANGSLPDILGIAQNYDSSLYFYGTSIVGTARLMGLNHLCFKAT
ncbi:MAG: hypothetical protein KJN62_07865 [Deltaproteobacteria bacterium]|nr:hypothetical protein [Deltaproteobacteria bacterium]